MKVVFAIPAYDGKLEARCVLNLVSSIHLLLKLNIEYECLVLENCAVLPVARNTLVSMFMNTDGTDLFFIDSDIGFDPEGVIKILKREEKIVAGIYPLKRDECSFPVQIKTKDGIPVGREGKDQSDYLIEADYLPTGFMRIKRCVIESMQKAYPELKYEGVPDEISESGKIGGYDFFNMGIEQGKRWATEDYAFCERWTAIGGQLWVYPNLEFEHVGKKAFKGNYHDYLMNGGR